MKTIPIIAVVLGVAWAVAESAPIVKTGACPTLTRYNAPSSEDWSQFPIKPNPLSAYPVGTIQDPLTPEQSVNCIEVPAGLKVEVWASEKNPGGIAYPQHFTFDERGRMWMVEPRSYPNTIRTASGSVTDQKFTGGADRILILEDTDGDRVMDSYKVFKDGLNLPQSIEVVNGGIVVAMVPYLVFFPNNNDVAGTPQILWSGMGGGNGNYDTHGGINSLTYGLDNWIYGQTGYNSCSADGVDCGKGRVWRFRHPSLGHAAKEFQVWTTGPSNAWGMGQMEDGQIFQSGATYSPHFNHSIRKGVASIDIRYDAASPNDADVRAYFYPITGDRFLWEGSTSKDSRSWFYSRSTAVSGLQFYTSRLLPKKYWNRFGFTCEGSSKLCNQDSLVVTTNGSNTGSTWRAMRMPGPARSNIIASTDAWVAPILAKTGPDGAVWVLDWYNYLFLHNPATPTGSGSAWNNALRAKTRYRIYRVTPADDTREPILNLANATVPQLVNTLSNNNMLWRLHAQRLLIAKGYTDEMGVLLENILTTFKGVDDVGNNPAVLHALWTLSGLGRLQLSSETARWNPILAKLLLHPAWGVRLNVLKAMPRTSASAQIISDACSVNDTHGHVRLQALVAFSEISSKPAGMKALFSTYQSVDTYAGTAFTASGLTSSATLPCSPTLDAVGTNPTVAAFQRQGQPRTDLHFTIRGQGLALNAHKQLNSGVLTVYDPSGRVVFTSNYDASSAKWSQPRAEGLTAPVYVYRFQSAKGDFISGQLSMVAGL